MADLTPTPDEAPDATAVDPVPTAPAAPAPADEAPRTDVDTSSDLERERLRRATDAGGYDALEELEREAPPAS